VGSVGYFPDWKQRRGEQKATLVSDWLRMTRVIPDASKDKVPVSGCQGKMQNEQEFPYILQNTPNVCCQMDDDIAKCAHFETHAANMLVGRWRSITTLLPGAR
jgi:hypothetical protein